MLLHIPEQHWMLAVGWPIQEPENEKDLWEKLNNLRMPDFHAEECDGCEQIHCGLQITQFGTIGRGKIFLTSEGNIINVK